VTARSKTSRLHVADPKARLVALNQLERSVAVATDEELEQLLASLPEEHRAEVTRLSGPEAEASPVPALRDAVRKGRVNGTAEALVVLLSDAALADTIEQLGDAAELPSYDDLQGVLPGIVERHGLAVTRMMLASAVAGDAPARATLQDILKHDEVLALPKAPKADPVEERPEAAPPSPEEEAERAQLKAQRAERKAKQKAEAEARRQQAAAAKRKH
jgi:hypothetical protein